MPTYEYACRDCGEHLEVVQSFKDAPLTECGRCGGQLRKVFSAAGIIFKGSGYYVTDSRTKPAGSSGAGGDSKDAGAADPGSAAASSTSDSPSKPDSSSSADSAKSA